MLLKKDCGGIVHPLMEEVALEVQPLPSQVNEVKGGLALYSVIAIGDSLAARSSAAIEKWQQR